MANYSNLKAAIEAAIKTNGNQEITGQVLQDVLTSMVSVIGANYTFAGVATPSTNPGTPDQNLTYIAMEGGTYTNFNGTVLPAGISLLMWNGAWTSNTVMYGDGGAFDISVYKSSGGTLATYADLSAALDGGNNIPASARKGGMSVKYVQSSDNKYVQYRLMAQNFSTTIDEWQGVDDEPTSNSDNLVKSGGVDFTVNERLQLINQALEAEHNVIEYAVLNKRNGWLDTSGNFHPSDSYRTSDYIETNGFDRLLFMGGGSSNISFVAFYDGTQSKTGNEVCESFSLKEFHVVDIPNGTDFIRVCNSVDAINADPIVILCKKITVNTLYFDTRDIRGYVSGSKTYGKIIHSTSFTLPSNDSFRTCDIIQSSGYIKDLSVELTLTNNYGVSIVRYVNLYVLTPNDNGQYSVKDTIKLRGQGGKTNYLNGVDFYYEKKLERGEILATWDGEGFRVSYVNAGGYSYNIYQGILDRINANINLSFTIVPSLYETTYGKNTLEIADRRLKVKSATPYRYDTGLVKTDLVSAADGQFITDIPEGGEIRCQNLLRLYEMEATFAIKPTSEYFDIRCGFKAWGGAFVGIKKDSYGSYLSIYNQWGGTGVADMTLAVERGVDTGGAPFEFNQGVTYYITMKKIADTSFRLLLTINSDDGDVYCEEFESYVDPSNMMGYYTDGFFGFSGALAIFSVTGTVKYIDASLRTPYKKSCQLLIDGHSFVGAGSFPLDVDKGFASLIVETLGVEQCPASGFGGAGIAGLNNPNATVRTMVTEYGYTPKYILEVYGTNNSSTSYNDIVAQLTSFISFCDDHNITPVLTTIPPMSSGYPTVFQQVNTWIRESGELYADIAKCFTYLDGTPKASCFMTDGVHPTLETHRAIYNTILHEVPQILTIE